MAEKLISYGREAREYLLKGLEVAYKTVGSTQGPKGRLVAIQTPVKTRIRLTKDGISVAKSLELTGFENEGLKIAKTASSICSEEVGDGTTQVVVLCRAIAKEGLADVVAGANPQDLKRGIELAVKECSKYIKEHSKPVQSTEEIIQVTTLSANSDPEIGKIVGEAIAKSGDNGAVEVEDSKTYETYIETINGYKINRGYDNPCYSTNEKLTAEYDNPMVLVVDGKILNLEAICQLLDFYHQKGQPVVVFAETFDDLVKHVFLQNRINNGLRIIPIQVSQFQKKNLDDIAALTGATKISEEMGQDVENWSPDMLGTCQKVKATKDYITLIGASETQKEAIESQIVKIKEEIANEEENDDNTYEIQKMKKRLGFLTDGVHIIRVGGVNETEVQEKKDRIDDALCAGTAAREEGIVPGGAKMYLNILNSGVLDNIKTANKDQARGVEILKRALTAPIETILKNGGIKADWVVGTLVSKENKDKFELGYDAQNEEFVDMFKEGIIDPAKVSRVALEASAKSACDVLTTEVIIIDKPEEKQNKMPPMQIPMGM